jgi:hypothetical protein
MRRIALLLILLAVMPVLASAAKFISDNAIPRARSAPAEGDMVCAVRTSCDAGEVAVFRMESTSNAHAGTFDGSSYDNVVCCDGMAGLGTNCSGVHDTVLFLSATNNAHVASYGGYPEEVCLSTETEERVTCRYRTSCGNDFACLATISGSTNAHVADCDGVDDYATKVCCYVGPPLPIGGIAEAPDAADSRSGSSSLPYAALTGAAAGVALLAAGGWYARRRWRAG